MDGAHWSACPIVPGATEASGRGPVPFHGCDEVSIVPVTGIGAPAALVERYMIRCAVAGITLGPPGTESTRGIGSLRTTSPFAAACAGKSAGGW